MTSFDPVRSIQRGLAVLRTISEHGPISVRDVVKLCGLPQPTVVRLIETLAFEGYIYRPSAQTEYRVTGKTLALSRGFDTKSRILDLAAPIVDQLHLQIGWPSNLAVFDTDAMVIVYSNRASLGLSIPGRLGARLPMLATGVGLATLAFMDEEERRVALQRALATGNRWDAIATNSGELLQKLKQIRKDGHAFADEVYLDEIYQSRIWAVAVPILTTGGQVRAALSSLVLRAAGERQRLLGSILPSLSAAANQIARLMEQDHR
jgi:IclR family transcriptional regulator, mhp operon transcriptional activator